MLARAVQPAQAVSKQPQQLVFTAIYSKLNKQQNYALNAALHAFRNVVGSLSNLKMPDGNSGWQGMAAAPAPGTAGSAARLIILAQPQCSRAC